MERTPCAAIGERPSRQAARAVMRQRFQQDRLLGQLERCFRTVAERAGHLRSGERPQTA